MMGIMTIMTCKHVCADWTGNELIKKYIKWLPCCFIIICYSACQVVYLKNTIIVEFSMYKFSHQFLLFNKITSAYLTHMEGDKCQPAGGVISAFRYSISFFKHLSVHFRFT